MADVHNVVSPTATIGGNVIQAANLGSVDLGSPGRPGRATVRSEGRTFGPDERQGIRLLMERRGELLPVLDEYEVGAVILLLETVTTNPDTAVFEPEVLELITRLQTRVTAARGPRD